MERTISEEEKIRKAIEISQRRNRSYYSCSNNARVNVNNKKEYKLFKRMIIQIGICLFIYFLFYLVTNTEYVFSTEIIKNTNNILNYDINFSKVYSEVKQYIELKSNEIENKNEGNIEEENIINKEEINNNNEEKVENIDKENLESEEIKNEEASKTQMELDAEEAKRICEFAKPLSGKITSEFGEREVTSKVMSADHKGIDIASNIGTNIQSSITGTVEVAGQNNEYGKFIKITNGEVMTVYAHCNELKVKVGEEVQRGQTIATVGSTGNSTGPHLHFEIRLSNRYINPRYIIEF